MENTSESQHNQTVNTSECTSQIDDASFRRTLLSVEEMIDAKVKKVLASKELVAAEAKLSLNALLLVAFFGLTIVCVTIVTWGLFNVGLIWAIYYLTSLMVFALFISISLNVCLIYYLYTRLNITMRAVGFQKTMAALSTEN